MKYCFQKGDRVIHSNKMNKMTYEGTFCRRMFNNTEYAYVLFDGETIEEIVCLDNIKLIAEKKKSGFAQIL